MGNVGNIEKVMVFGILAIIMVILSIAVWGHNQGNDPVPYGAEVSALDSDEVKDSNFRLALDEPIDGAPKKANGKNDKKAPASDYVLVPDEDEFDANAEVDDLSAHPEPPKSEPKSKVSPSESRLPRTYEVAKGDTFEKIAVKLFGDRAYITELMKANEDVDPLKMRIGDVLNVPQIDAKEIKFDSQPSTTPARASGTPATAKASGTYEVRKGDTLIAIARNHYGSDLRWKDILDANRKLLSSPTDLRPGMVLNLP